MCFGSRKSGSFGHFSETQKKFECGVIWEEKLYGKRKEQRNLKKNLNIEKPLKQKLQDILKKINTKLRKITKILSYISPRLCGCL